MHTIQDIFDTIKDNEIRFVDFRFTDLRGTWHHITTSADLLDEDTFKEGFNFDGSSVEGWCPINESDMYYVPDPATAHIDPFMSHPTLVLVCSIVDAATNKPYHKDPRTIAQKAEDFLEKSGIADTAYIGPELEFFLFDDVRFKSDIHESFYHIDAASGSWATGKKMEQGNTGHIAPVKGGYFKMPPVDRAQDIRSEMLEIMRNLGMPTRLHHSEVGTASQCEVGVDASTLMAKGDEIQLTKYVVRTVADTYGLTSTFMPKPLAGDNGSGMHVHQSLWKKSKPLFAGDAYNGLSQEALYYIGGIIKHAKALNAFTNPLTNSYKRLIPGYEAPVILTYAGRNRSAAIRIPASNSANAKRVEVRFPDPGANPYLAFSAMLMAGIDGIKNKIDPGKAMEQDLYELPQKELDKLPQVCGSLREALEALNKDREFLKQGDVFNDDVIDSYIELKMEEVIKLEHNPHPVEFEMYYGI
jgi:glutamine synthetase